MTGSIRGQSRRFRVLPSLAIVLCAGTLLLASDAIAQKRRPPSAKRVLALAAEYFGLDGTRLDGFRRREEILVELDKMPPITAREVASWRKKLCALAAKGRKLPKDSGEHWWWGEEKKSKRRKKRKKSSEPKRGRYFIGGQLKRPKGLVIGMHGGGRGSGNAASSHSAYAAAARKLGWIAIFPEVLEKTEHGWTDSGTEEWILELIAAARRTWKIDPNRVFLCGHSMGGYGSWTLGGHHADLLAAIAPSAGAPTPILSRDDNSILDVDEGVVPNLRNLRAVIYQSDDDPRVPPGPNRMAVKKLAEAKKKWGGYDFEYWEVSGRGHAMAPGGAIAHLEKIAKSVRDPLPPRIVWQPTLAWKNVFYWLHWPKPRTNAILVATLDKKANRILLECDEPLLDLEILADERLVDMSRELVVATPDEVLFRGVPQPSLSALVLTAVRNDPAHCFSARVSLRKRGN